MVKKFFYILLLLFVLLSIAVASYFMSNITTKHNIKLPSSNIDEVVEYLANKKIDVGPLDKLFLKFTPKPIEGWIYFNKKSMPRYQFLLLLSKRAIHYRPITIVPGETSYYVLESLAEKLKFSKEKLEQSYKKYAPYKEGNFLADTYNIPLYFDEDRTIKFIINTSFKHYKALSKEYFNDYNQRSWKRVVTIASIIEKEAANKKEMPIVASVIFNRLDKNMRLQMDGTLNYGAYSHKKITPQRIREDKSFYNTYKHKGLPKEPVCNVSLAALKAALAPAKTKYLYFMKNKNGTHDFSVEYKTHIQNVKKRREEEKK